MKKILDKIAGIQITLAGIFFFVIFLVNMLEIISRTVFNYSFLWVSDLSIICVTWMICLGMSAGIHYREHLFMEILVNKLPAKLRQGINITISFISFAFFVMLFFVGLQTAGTKTALIFPSIEWSLVWAYSALPVFAFSSAVFTVPRLIDLVKGKNSNQAAHHNPMF